MANKRGLGKGLQALIPSVPPGEDDSSNKIKNISVKKIKPNTYQPRREFSESKLQELAQSIKEHGVIQPVVVRKLDNDYYQLIAGERRWRACVMLDLETIPAVVKDLDDAKTTELALIENIQREDLNPIEEAWAYKTLLEEFSLTQEQLSQSIGKSRPAITNTLRLLNLECDVQDMLASGELSMGHARALLSIEDPSLQVELAKKINKEGLSVRQTEKLVKGILEKGKVKKEIKLKQDIPPEINALQERLQEHFGTKVTIKYGKKKGSIVIDYYGDDDLNRILELLDAQ
ncbi:MAG: ParB/RepB/Spo0J family partition protein [Thermoanaerobacteraceae bacterium]|nr:ParB/RepB/Spo0J family partition protein [Thermoanaerobacteraceae bacterium]